VIGAPPPPIFCQRAADAILGVFIFSMLSMTKSLLFHHFTKILGEQMPLPQVTSLKKSTGPRPPPRGKASTIAFRICVEKDNKDE